MKKFLVVVDTQYDFMMPDGALYVPGAEQLIVPGNEFLATLNPNEYEGVLFTFDTHETTTWASMKESEEFPIHCDKNTSGWQNVFNSALVHRDILLCSLEKGVFSMWEEDSVEIVAIANRAKADPNPITNVYAQPGTYSKTSWLRDDFFNQYDKKTTLIEVIGVASDYCVRQAVDGFVKLGFAVHVRDELCCGIAATAKETFDTAEYIGNVVVR